MISLSENEAVGAKEIDPHGNRESKTVMNYPNLLCKYLTDLAILGAVYTAGRLQRVLSIEKVQTFTLQN